MSEHKSQATGALLLEIGVLLMCSGANTNRVRLTISRIAKSYGYTAEYLITHRAILLTLHNPDKQVFNAVKQTQAHIPNFKMVSGISRLSWRIVEENLSLDDAWKETERLKNLPHYPRLLVLCVVALACSAFCRLSGGNFVEMAVVFSAAFCGLFTKQELAKKKFNPYFGVMLSSFVATLITGGAIQCNLYNTDSVAIITAILYLIPGIPLINSMSDILDGHAINGLVRAVNGFAISFAIAAGLLIALLMYNIN